MVFLTAWNKLLCIVFDQIGFKMMVPTNKTVLFDLKESLCIIKSCVLRTREKYFERTQLYYYDGLSQHSRYIRHTHSCEYIEYYIYILYYVVDGAKQRRHSIHNIYMYIIYICDVVYVLVLIRPVRTYVCIYI